MRAVRGLWGGWVWFVFCQCTAAPNDRAPDAGRAETMQRTLPSSWDASVATPADAAMSSSTQRPGNDAAEPRAGRHAEPAVEGGSGVSKPETTPLTNVPEDEADSGTGDVALEDSSCLDASGKLDAPGTFQFEAKTVRNLELWLPKLPSGCKAPVVHFANGTGATCSSYQPVLERLASHGFVRGVHRKPEHGHRRRRLASVRDRARDGPRAGRAQARLGRSRSGWSGAIITLQQAETKWGARAIYAGMAIAPASGQGAQPPNATWQDAYKNLRSPMLMMSGSEDALVSESRVGEAYELLNDSVEAYWYSGVGAPHIPVPHELIQQLAIPWFRWKLLRDNQACEYFKQLPQPDRWDERAQQNAQSCH